MVTSLVLFPSETRGFPVRTASPPGTPRFHVAPDVPVSNAFPSPVTLTTMSLLERISRGTSRPRLLRPYEIKLSTEVESVEDFVFSVFSSLNFPTPEYHVGTGTGSPGTRKNETPLVGCRPRLRPRLVDPQGE